jgi:hypothetical protein
MTVRVGAMRRSAAQNQNVIGFCSGRGPAIVAAFHARGWHGTRMSGAALQQAKPLQGKYVQSKSQ